MSLEVLDAQMRKRGIGLCRDGAVDSFGELFKCGLSQKGATVTGELHGRSWGVKRCKSRPKRGHRHFFLLLLLPYDRLLSLLTTRRPVDGETLLGLHPSNRRCLDELSRCTVQRLHEGVRPFCRLQDITRAHSLPLARTLSHSPPPPTTTTTTTAPNKNSARAA